jgi:hypothetical protein
LTLDDLNSLTESESEAEMLYPQLRTDWLDDDFLGLEGEDEIDLANLVDKLCCRDSFAEVWTLIPESRKPLIYLGLLESEDLFNFNQSRRVAGA